MNETTNHPEQVHQFPAEEQCWRIVCAITYFGGGSDHIHCETTQSCGAMRITGLEGGKKERVPRLQF
tara:strand:+ start:212 stop:412 length:201 start_codon:yes stop_codon:yes gene_type:complete